VCRTRRRGQGRKASAMAGVRRAQIKASSRNSKPGARRGAAPPLGAARPGAASKMGPPCTPARTARPPPRAQRLRQASAGLRSGRGQPRQGRTGRFPTRPRLLPPGSWRPRGQGSCTRLMEAPRPRLLPLARGGPEAQAPAPGPRFFRLAPPPPPLASSVLRCCASPRGAFGPSVQPLAVRGAMGCVAWLGTPLGGVPGGRGVALAWRPETRRDHPAQVPGVRGPGALGGGAAGARHQVYGGRG